MLSRHCGGPFAELIRGKESLICAVRSSITLWLSVRALSLFSSLLATARQGGEDAHGGNGRADEKGGMEGRGTCLLQGHDLGGRQMVAVLDKRTPHGGATQSAEDRGGYGHADPLAHDAARGQETGCD